MPQPVESPRRFSVHVSQAERTRARIVEESSFEAAAIAYLEDFHPTVDEDHEIRIIVRDLDEGGEHCFRIDLDSGETAPCA
jgi:hypothetical protein